jgi:hypothetical protein
MKDLSLINLSGRTKTNNMKCNDDGYRHDGVMNCVIRGHVRFWSHVWILCVVSPLYHICSDKLEFYLRCTSICKRWVQAVGSRRLAALTVRSLFCCSTPPNIVSVTHFPFPGSFYVSVCKIKTLQPVINYFVIIDIYFTTSFTLDPIYF